MTYIEIVKYFEVTEYVYTLQARMEMIATAIRVTCRSIFSGYENIQFIQSRDIPTLSNL